MEERVLLSVAGRSSRGSTGMAANKMLGYHVTREIIPGIQYLPCQSAKDAIVRLWGN